MHQRIKNSCRAALFAVGIFIAADSHAQATWDFQYSYANIFAPNALNYVVGQQNIQRTDEGDGITYWNPISNGTPAFLTQKFTFSAPSTEIYLSTDIASFNLGDGLSGSGSLWASTDGANWTQLLDAPTPASGGYGYNYTADLPSSLLGTDQIYIQARLETSGLNIAAQFNREDGVNNPIFALNANVVPEPSSVCLLILGGLSVFGFNKFGKLRFYNRCRE